MCVNNFPKVVTSIETVGRESSWPISSQPMFKL